MGFEKIALEPKEFKRVTFKIDRSLLNFFHSELEFVVERGMSEVFIGGSSVDVTKLEFELKQNNLYNKPTQCRLLPAQRESKLEAICEQQ